MRAIERQWANAVLSGFLVGELPREQGAAPPLGDVDYSSGIASLIEHGNPIASAGVRVALATIVTAPLWHWGQRRTMVDMSPEERCAILAELVDHPLFAVRELAILMKIQASMALFKSPAMRAWSGYGREDNRRHLGVLRAVPGGCVMAKYLMEDVADFVVVGTGAGGATAARVLSAAGHSVVMLEEGGWLNTPDRPRDMVGAMADAMRDAGSQATRDAAPMPLLQGVAVGGSTAINSGIIWRLPEDVRADWTRQHGLGELVDERGLSAAFDAIERDLEVAETSDELLGRNGGLMRTAAERLGLPGRAMVRNSKRCQGSGECLQGCKTEARRSMDVSYVPMAMRDGARLHTHCRVSQVERSWGRATGVVGDVLGETKKPMGRFRVRARRGVIIAAGVLHTPVILLKSGLRGMVGERFQAHPGSAMVGRFADPVSRSTAATQAYEIPMRERGFKIESLTMPPEMLSARLPGVGSAWLERMAHLDHYAHWVAQCRFEAKGRVRVGFDGRPAVTYQPTPRDVRVLMDGLALVAELLFEVGAQEVYPGIHGVPEVLRSAAEVSLLRQPGIVRGDLHMVASHLFGTAVAGANARTSVVNPSLEAHALRGLFVMDGSVFPTNLGVNPQHSIMGVVHRAADKLANQERAGQSRHAS